MGIELRERRPRPPNRKAQILNVLTSGDPGGMTADEIGAQLVAMGEIPYNDPSFTRPRLTELKSERKVAIVDRRPGIRGCGIAVWKVVKR